MIFGTRPFHLAISRFLSGFVVGGAQMCLFLFVAEIADNDIRGQLGTVVSYARSFGILIAFSLGSYFTYIISAIFFTGITITFFVITWFVPSTPQYFLHKNNVEVKCGHGCASNFLFLFENNSPSTFILQAAQASFNHYNKHRLETENKYCLNHFENLKLNAQEDGADAKFTWNDFGE